MKKLIFILPILFLSGCSTPAMKNEEIIKASNLCEEAGLIPKIFENIRGQITLIQCKPITPTP